MDRQHQRRHELRALSATDLSERPAAARTPPVPESGQAAFPFLHFLSFSPFFKEGGAAWRKFWDQRHWLFCSEKHAKLCACLQFFVVLPVKI
jgi:hypothetical protein